MFTCYVQSFKFLSKTYLPPKSTGPRKRWLCPNMTEKLFTGTLSIKPKKPKVSRLYLASVAEQASLDLTWSDIPKDTCTISCISLRQCHVIHEDKISFCHSLTFARSLGKVENLGLCPRFSTLPSGPCKC